MRIQLRIRSISVPSKKWNWRIEIEIQRWANCAKRRSADSLGVSSRDPWTHPQNPLQLSGLEGESAIRRSTWTTHRKQPGGAARRSPAGGRVPPTVDEEQNNFEGAICVCTAAAAAATAAAHTRTAASLFSSSDVRERRVRVSALLSIFLSFSVSLFVPLAAFSSGSVSAAEDGAHGSERFGSKRDEAKTRGKSAWGESRPCLVGERCERRAVERRRRRGERDASFRATGWGIVSRTAWWGATNRGFVPERRRKGQRSGTAPLLSVSLSPSGGVQSSRASRATRTRLFHVLGSVKDSLSQGLENGSRQFLSPRDHGRSPVNRGGYRRVVETWTGVGTSAFLFFSLEPSAAGSWLAYQPAARWTVKRTGTRPPPPWTEATEHPHFLADLSLPHPPANRGAECSAVQRVEGTPGTEFHGWRTPWMRRDHPPGRIVDKVEQVFRDVSMVKRAGIEVKLSP